MRNNGSPSRCAILADRGWKENRHEGAGTRRRLRLQPFIAASVRDSRAVMAS